MHGLRLGALNSVFPNERLSPWFKPGIELISFCNLFSALLKENDINRLANDKKQTRENRSSLIPASGGFLFYLPSRYKTCNLGKRALITKHVLQPI